MVQMIHLRRTDLEFSHAGPARVGRQLGAILLRLQANGGRLDPQWQVLADQDNALPFRRQAACDREDPRVVVTQPEAGREH
jgi:hypothetical protein